MYVTKNNITTKLPSSSTGSTVCRAQTRLGTRCGKNGKGSLLSKDGAELPIYTSPSIADYMCGYFQ